MRASVAVGLLGSAVSGGPKHTPPLLCREARLSPVNWRFAFGLRAGNRVAVVSYARMDPRFFGRPEATSLLQRRLRRMVTKDLGLMLYGLYGLSASADPASPIYRDIGGLDELDAMQDDLASAGFPVRRLPTR
jgi:hypothetical protein